MTPHYLAESGICPWELCDQLADPRFATITLLGSSPAALLPLIETLLPALGGRFDQWFRWYTMGGVYDGNFVLRRKLIATLSADRGAFRDTVVRTDDPIISSVARIILPISVSDLEILGDYRRELLVGCVDSSVTPALLAVMLAPLAADCSPTSLVRFLAGRNDLIFARCLADPDTHFAIQWFGSTSDLRMLEAAIVTLNVRFLASRNEAANRLQQND